MSELLQDPCANRFERRRRQNRAALIDAAIEIFQRKGVRGTRLEEVCERADVSQRTFFNHFATREHLYEAIGRQRAHQLASLFDAASQDPRPFAERITELFESVGAYLSARPLYRELVGEMLHVRTDGGSEIARSHSLGQASLRFIQTACTRGEVHSRHAPETLADIMLGTLTTAVTNWSTSVDYDLERALEEAALALLDLFAPPEPVAATRRAP